jgi:hypothetical protein
MADGEFTPSASSPSLPAATVNGERRTSPKPNGVAQCAACHTNKPSSTLDVRRVCLDCHSRGIASRRDFVDYNQRVQEAHRQLLAKQQAAQQAVAEAAAKAVAAAEAIASSSPTSDSSSQSSIASAVAAASSLPSSNSLAELVSPISASRKHALEMFNDPLIAAVTDGPSPTGSNGHDQPQVKRHRVDPIHITVEVVPPPKAPPLLIPLGGSIYDLPDVAPGTPGYAALINSMVGTPGGASYLSDMPMLFSTPRGSAAGGFSSYDGLVSPAMHQTTGGIPTTPLPLPQTPGGTPFMPASPALLYPPAHSSHQVSPERQRHQVTGDTNDQVTFSLNISSVASSSSSSTLYSGAASTITDFAATMSGIEIMPPATSSVSINTSSTVPQTSEAVPAEPSPMIVSPSSTSVSSISSSSSSVGYDPMIASAATPAPLIHITPPPSSSSVNNLHVIPTPPRRGRPPKVKPADKAPKENPVSWYTPTNRSAPIPERRYVLGTELQKQQQLQQQQQQQTSPHGGASASPSSGVKGARQGYVYVAQDGKEDRYTLGWSKHNATRFMNYRRAGPSSRLRWYSLRCSDVRHAVQLVHHQLDWFEAHRPDIVELVPGTRGWWTLKPKGQTALTFLSSMIRNAAEQFGVDNNTSEVEIDSDAETASDTIWVQHRANRRAELVGTSAPIVAV